MLVREVRAIPFGLLDRPEDENGEDTWRDNARRLADNAVDTGGAGVAQKRPCFEMHVPAEKVRILIGKEGSTIREISEKSRCILKVDKEAGEEEGMVCVLIQPLPPGAHIHSAAKGGDRKEDDALEAGDVQEAIKLITESIDDRARTIKQGIYPGAVLYVRVGKVTDFGAFVVLPHGKEGLLHISELSNDRVESVTEIVDVGDELYVVVLSVDERGRPRLSIKDVDQEHGTFYGRLEMEDTSGSKTARASLPVRLDDKSLWPSLDAVPAPVAPESNARTTGAVKTEQEINRQEWKDRIRQQREKAAQEAAHLMQNSGGASRAGTRPAAPQYQHQQPPPRGLDPRRQQQQQMQAQEFRSGNLQRGGDHKTSMKPLLASIDQDYRSLSIPHASALLICVLRSGFLQKVCPLPMSFVGTACTSALCLQHCILHSLDTQSASAGATCRSG